MQRSTLRKADARGRSMERRHLSVLAGLALTQLISILGSRVSIFALGLWVYRQTGSITRLALISVAASLPGILVAPLAGVAVDRWDRRRIVIACEAGMALSMLALAAIVQAGRLEEWHIYVNSALHALLLSFLIAAYPSIIAATIPPERLGSANGILETARSVGHVSGPLLAGVLAGRLPLQSLLLIDAVSFVFPIAAIAMLLRSSPRPPGDGASKQAFSEEITYGLVYLRRHQGLFALILLLAVSAFFMSATSVLLTPLVLGFADAPVLGLVMASQSVGMMAGSLWVGLRGGPRRRIDGVLGFYAAAGLFVLLSGARPSTALLAAASGGVGLSAALVMTGYTTILQRVVPIDTQGRVWAIHHVLFTFFQTLSYVAAGPLTERLFEPALHGGGASSKLLTYLVGEGQGRGIALFFVLSGFLLMLLSLLGYLHPPLRQVEGGPPDAGAGPASKGEAAPPQGGGA